MDTTYCSYRPGSDYTLREDCGPLDRIWDYLERQSIDLNRCADRQDDAIDLRLDWLKSSDWHAFDLARYSSGVARSEFTVRKQGQWDDHPPVTARIERGAASPLTTAPVPLHDIVETLEAYHPFPVDDCTPRALEYKCGDISALFREALWHEYGLNVPIVSGGVYDPETGEGWGHGFIVIQPEWTTDTDAPVIVDGTAKQFHDEWDWPQTLGAAADIDTVHVVGPNHPHRQYYATDRDSFDCASQNGL